jgi:hypothetical protein
MIFNQPIEDLDIASLGRKPVVGACENDIALVFEKSDE